MPSNSAKLEKRIQQQLKEASGFEASLGELVDDYFDPHLSGLRKRQLSYFLLQAGQMTHVIDRLITDIEAKRPIPWDIFLELYSMNRVRIPQDVAEALIEASMTMDGSQWLGYGYHASKQDKQFQFFRDELFDLVEKQFAERKQNLLDRLEFARQELILEEEKRALDLIEKEFPEALDVASLKEQFQQRWAQEIIRKSKLKSRYEPKPRIRKDEDQRRIDSLLKFWLDESAEDSTLRYHLAILMVMAEEYRWALRFIDGAKESVEKDWLKVELLRMAGRHIDALNELDRIELKYADDTESVFAVSFERARNLWELQRKSEAVKIMEQIIHLRPEYRFARHLFDLWSSVEEA